MNIFSLIFSILNFAPLATTVVQDIESAVQQIAANKNGFNILSVILSTIQTIETSVQNAIAAHPANPANSTAAPATTSPTDQTDQVTTM